MWLCCGIWQVEHLHSRRGGEPAFNWRLTRGISKRIWSYWPRVSAQTQVKKGQNLCLPFCLQLLQHRIYKQIFWLGKTSYGGWIRMSCQIPHEILETYSLQESTFLWSKFLLISRGDYIFYLQSLWKYLKTSGILFGYSYSNVKIHEECQLKERNYLDYHKLSKGLITPRGDL